MLQRHFIIYELYNTQEYRNILNIHTFLYFHVDYYFAPNIGV